MSAGLTASGVADLHAAARRSVGPESSPAVHDAVRAAAYAALA